MFEVEWIRSALDELTELWTEADSSLRNAITTATNQIDQDLGSDALHQGESRDGNRRIHFVEPLGVIYRVEPDRSVALVLHVWKFEKRTSSE